MRLHTPQVNLSEPESLVVNTYRHTLSYMKSSVTAEQEAIVTQSNTGHSFLEELKVEKKSENIRGD